MCCLRVSWSLPISLDCVLSALARTAFTVVRSLCWRHSASSRKQCVRSGLDAVAEDTSEQILKLYLFPLYLGAYRSVAWSASYSFAARSVPTSSCRTCTRRDILAFVIRRSPTTDPASQGCPTRHVLSRWRLTRCRSSKGGSRSRQREAQPPSLSPPFEPSLLNHRLFLP
jgi:hypothetical protein